VSVDTINKGIINLLIARYCSRGDRCKFSHPNSNPPVNTTFNFSVKSSDPIYSNNGLMDSLNAAAAAYFAQHGGAASQHDQMVFQPTPPASSSSGVSASNNISRLWTNRDEEFNRFSRVPFENLVGQLYSLCLDQHGCRYLQKKLEDRDPGHLEQIFTEVYPHVVDLMTDPFGNYLVQRLIEYSGPNQLLLIVEAVGPNIIEICLNMHGIGVDLMNRDSSRTKNDRVSIYHSSGMLLTINVC
jgi:hypothetical protein